MPDGAFNRLADNWRPLLAVAELAGGGWPARAREAFRLLTATSDMDAQGLGAMLLTDIREVFGREGQGRLTSRALADALGEFEGRPWAEFGKSRRPISPNQLATQLKKFGVAPRMMHIPGEEKNKRGYDVADFAEVFERFLPPPPTPSEPPAEAAPEPPKVPVAVPGIEPAPQPRRKVLV
jgi:hypothetical protein